MTALPSQHMESDKGRTMKKIKCHSQYGYYERPQIKLPDRTLPSKENEEHAVDAKTLFRLRIKALLLNDEFRIFCSCPGIADQERDALNVWRNFPVWAKDHKEDHCLVALLFYGDIFHNPIGQTWTRFKTAIENAYEASRPFPFHELSPGTPAPPDSKTISFDPALRHKDLLQLFQGFLSMMKKVDTVQPALSGYFEIQLKAKLNDAPRFIDAAKIAARLREDHPKTWLNRMANLYSEYQGNAESRRKTIYSDIKKGHNISYWALRGLFPKTSNPSK